MPVPGHQNITACELKPYRHIEVKPAGLALGAYVCGLDLSMPPSKAVLEDIADALWCHHVLFFRDQDLSPQAHVALASHFGSAEVHEIFKRDPDHPEISLLINDENNPPEINVWHTDVTYRAQPTLCTILHCVEPPNVGGDTLFLNTQAAYETLSAPIRELLLGLEMEHDILKVYTGTKMLENAGGDEYAARLRKTMPPVTHPAVIAHPITGKAGLLVNPTHARHFLGMSTLESDKLMDLVCSHQQLAEFQVRFSWQKNSIAMWDNFSTQHYAVADYFPRRRHMRRVTVAGYRPQAFRPLPKASAA